MNLKIKKLKLKIEWLRLELDETNQIFGKCLDKFYKDFAYCMTDAKKDEPVDHEEPFSASPEITNKLFKEIAIKNFETSFLLLLDDLKPSREIVMTNAEMATKGNASIGYPGIGIWKPSSFTKL